MALAATALAFLLSAPPANAAEPTCTPARYPVTIASLAQTMAATLCVPAGGASAVQVLVPGGFYNRGYWDIPVDPATHSFRRAMNEGGYATLTVDRLGTGASSVPPSVLLTAITQADAVHQVVQVLRQRFDKVFLGGHSLGSAISIIEAARYRDVDGVLVTGMGHHLNVLGLAPIAATFVPAVLDPAFSGRPLDLGYLTTMSGTRWRSLHAPGPYDAAIDALDEATKDVVAPTELVDAALLGTVTPYTRKVGVPVLTVMAGADPTFCGLLATDCSSSAALLRAEAPFYGPAARLQAYVLPGYGHALNYAPNAPDLHDVVVRWADRMIRR
jgi:pimeloyl-ACP methyl ester carboxylesterase